MSLTLQIQLSDADLERLAEMVAAKRGASDQVPNKPHTVSEAAERLGVSPRTIRRRIEAGLIKTIPELGHVRIAPSEIRRLLGESPTPDDKR